MNDTNSGALPLTRIMISLLPLLFGAPFLSFFLCAWNGAMAVILGGPVRGGVTNAVTAALLVALCALSGFGAAYGALMAAQIVLVSVVCSVCVLTRRPFSVGLISCAAAYGLVQLGGLKLQAEQAGLSIAENLLSGLNGPLRESFTAAIEQSGLDASLADRFFTAMEAAVRYSIPAALVIISLVGGYTVMWAVSHTLRETPVANGHSFSYIRPGLAAVLYGAVMAALLLLNNKGLRIVAVNGLIVFAFLLFADGMSLADWLLRRKVRRVGVRMLIHCGLLALGLLFPLLNVFLIYILAGLVDSFVPIRKRVTLSK